MDFDPLISEVDVQVEMAKRYADEQKDLEFTPIIVASCYDSKGNELVPAAWRLSNGCYVLGYFFKPVEGDTYLVVFRQCEVEGIDEIPRLAARLTKAACPYERLHAAGILRR